MFHYVENVLWLGRAGQQYAGCSDCQRKIKAVTQAIGEKKLGHTEKTVAFRGVQNRLRIALGANDHIMLQVHTGLRSARASRRIEPESSVVFGGARRIERDGTVADPLVERERAWSFCAVTNDDEFFDIRKLLPWNCLQVREKSIAYNPNSRARVVEQEFVVRRLQQRVDGNRHGSDLDGAKKASRKFRRVQQKQEDSFFDANTQFLESVSNPVHRLKELAVSHAPLRAFDCNFL